MLVVAFLSTPILLDYVSDFHPYEDKDVTVFYILINLKLSVKYYVFYKL